jgi:hypothetical protein
VFHQRLNTKGEFVSGIKIVSVLNQVANTVLETKKVIKTMSFETNKQHKLLGYSVENHLKVSENNYGIKVLGKQEDCEACAISMANQKKINKLCTGSSDAPRERIYVNTWLNKK